MDFHFGPIIRARHSFSSYRISAEILLERVPKARSAAAPVRLTLEQLPSKPEVETDLLSEHRLSTRLQQLSATSGMHQDFFQRKCRVNAVHVQNNENWGKKYNDLLALISCHDY